MEKERERDPPGAPPPAEEEEDSPENAPPLSPPRLASAEPPAHMRGAGAEDEGDDDSPRPEVPEDETPDCVSPDPRDNRGPALLESDLGEDEEGRAPPEEEEGGVPLRQRGEEQQQQTGEGQEEAPGGDEEEAGGQGEAGRDQRANGESVWRGREGGGGGGRRGRSRNSGGGGAAPEQSSQTTTSSSSSFLPKGSAPPGSGGGRHKQARRRNHHHPGRGRRRMGSQLALAVRELLSASLGPWCVSCVRMVAELIVAVTHHCGVCVETGGLALYGLGSRLLARVTDVPAMRADAGRALAWGRGVREALAERSTRAARWVRQSVALLLALLCAVVLLGSQGARGALGRLGGERGRRWGAALRESRVWRGAAWLGQRVGGWIRSRGGTRASRNLPSAPDSPGGTGGRYQPGQELERLLALALVPEEELDPFSVLGVEASATEAELKRAYRQLAVQVHPDKNKHPRAGEAFKVLRAAWDIVSNPETRREYEIKRMAATELSKSMNEFLTKLQDDLKEAMNTMMCTKCEGKHKRFEMDRDPAEARFCAECNRRHGAEEGDLWAESSMLGLRITYFACMDGKVFDITEWAGCQRIGISPDTHRVPYHISFSSKNNSSSTRRPPSEQHPPGPSSPADLQDFFHRIFQGGPPSDMAANGGFFPPGPPPPHHHPPGAGPSGPFPPPPPPQTGGFFMPGGPRPEPGGEPGGESAKPPRRRKKVRKPFQR